MKDNDMLIFGNRTCQNKTRRANSDMFPFFTGASRNPLRCSTFYQGNANMVLCFILNCVY